MTTDVAIIGGGLSGLAAAVELASHGVHVALYEQAPKLGGRCYSYTDESTGDIVDNGQHVLIGAYKNTFRYLGLIGTKQFLRAQNALQLPLYHPAKGFAEFKVSRLPKPLHVTAGMLKFNLLSFKERQQLLNIGIMIRRWNSKLEQHLSSLTVDQWLTELHQSNEAKQCLWFPLAISIMNELPGRASAMLFARSLKSALLGKKSDASMFIPVIGQTELYVTPAERFLLDRKAKIFRNAEVTTVDVSHSRATGITLKDGTGCHAKHVIIAVPPHSLEKLLPKELQSLEPFSHAEQFSCSPIVSIHLWFEREFMKTEFLGLINSRLQWIFNRRKIIGGEKSITGFLSAVISGAYDVVDLPKEQIVKIALEDLQKVFPESGKTSLLHSIVIKEKRATFSPTNDVEAFRPGTVTPIENCLMAGDWTNTGVPATIEGAVLSGFKAAKVILQSPA